MFKLLVNLFVIFCFLWIAFLLFVPIIKLVFTIIFAILSAVLPVLFTLFAVGLVVCFFVALFK